MLRYSFSLSLILLLHLSAVAIAADKEKSSDELVQQIVKLLSDPDREFRAAGLDQLRTSAKGAAATEQFVAQLPKLDTDGQVALLHALADRGDATARTAVLELIGTNKEARVRAAAIGAMVGCARSAWLAVLT